MKINEPKTPYTKHYDPAEDPSDEDEPMDGGDNGGEGRSRRNGTRRSHGDDEIPGLSLGEPEDEVLEDTRERTVHVDADAVGGEGHHEFDADEMVGLSPEEREKHRRFEELRKRHYEMRDVAHLLGHPEDLDALAEDEEGGDGARQNGSAAAPPVPPLPRVDRDTNGRAP